jgi:citrate synthase
MIAYYSAQDAAARLGVSRTTLYSYVSRGLLRAHAADNSRERRYLVAEVTQLAAKRARGHNPRHAAKDALQWGLPVVESAVCSIDGGRLYYRGKDAVKLVDTASVEEVGAMLWQCPVQDVFPSRFSVRDRVWKRTVDDPAMSVISSFALAARDLQSDSWLQIPGCSAQAYGNLVRILAGCVLRTNPSAAPLHEQCAKAWRLGARQQKLIQAALILCADHELNASSFTVRCVASTGASLHGAVLGGLAALSGLRHGGLSFQVERLWDEIGASARPEAALRAALERSGHLPGFGHRLYPDGDVRAAAILNRIPLQLARWRSLTNVVEQLTGLKPNIDFALVALRRHLKLPAGSAFRLFALGRSLGWIAHALEQRAQGNVIRPRASYTGPPPERVGALDEFLHPVIGTPHLINFAAKAPRQPEGVPWADPTKEKS